MRASVRPLAAVVVGDIGNVLWVVLAAAGFVLAIACANVTNLFLVRAEGRRKALAVQRALGAAAGLVFMEFLSEGFSSRRGRRTRRAVRASPACRRCGRSATPIDIPRLAEVNVDATMLGVAALRTVLAALFVSGVPAVRSGGASTSSVLMSTSRSMTAGRAAPPRSTGAGGVAGGARAHRARRLGTDGEERLASSIRAAWLQPCERESVSAWRSRPPRIQAPTSRFASSSARSMGSRRSRVCARRAPRRSCRSTSRAGPTPQCSSRIVRSRPARFRAFILSCT